MVAALAQSNLSAQIHELQNDVRWLDRQQVLQPHAPEGALHADSGLIVCRSHSHRPMLTLPFAVASGDVIAIEIELEATTTATESDTGQAGLILSILPTEIQGIRNHEVDFRQIVLIGSEPERFRFAFVSPQSYAMGESGLLFALSYFHRPVWVKSISVVNHGKDIEPEALTAGVTSYIGQEADAPWRAIAQELIRRHRMADITVIVTDREGNPLPDATVSVVQREHAYPFGTAGVASRIVDGDREFNPQRFPDPEAARAQFPIDNIRYRKALLENFNTVVYENDLKWPQWGHDRPGGNFNQHWTMDSMDWLRKHRIAIKGHTMVWGSWRFSPEWLRDMADSPERLQSAVLTHIRDIGNATGDYATWWDVLNEPMSHRDVIELLGTGAVAEWFKEARIAMPDVRLVINEFDLVGNGGNADRRNNFIAFCHELLSHDAPIDVIGFQGHFWSDRLTPPETIWRIIDEVHTALERPVMISEFDMNLPNEALQAAYTGDFMTAWFAHPATEAFIMWGFWGGNHWMGDTGAMIRNDWSLKPVYHVYRDLVFNQWWTRASTTTNADGVATIRAFHGRHDITVAMDGRLSAPRRLTLGADGRTLHVVLTGDPIGAANP